METFDDSTVTPGQTYYYWVRATNSTSESLSDFSASDSGFAVNAATYEWDAGGGAGDRDWSTAANWTGDTEPTITDESYIGNNFTSLVTVASERTAELSVGLTGYGRTGTVEQTGGDLVIATNLTLGAATGDKGTYLMTGGDLVVSNDVFVGASGKGAFTLNGADADMIIGNTLQIADSDANNQAIFTHNAGTVTVVDVRIGRLSATEGKYTMDGGLLDIGNSVYLADGNGNATGRMEISGSAIVTMDDDLIVGKDGLGIFSLFGNATVSVIGATSHLILGDDTGANKANQVQIDGNALLDIGGDIYLGDASESYGSLAVSGGVLSAVGDLFIGDDAGGTGAVEVTGGVIDLADEQGYVGYAGLGTYDQSGGTAAFEQFIVGDLSTSTGDATISAGTLNTEGDLIVGGAGDGTFTISGTASVNVGTNSSGDADFFVGQSSGGNGTVIQGGGTVTGYDNASLILGPVAGASGAYKISGGTLNLNTTGGANGDNIDIFYGTLHLVGDAWTITIDDDFTMNNASSAVTVEFDASTLGTVSVDDDIILTGTLNVTNDGTGINPGSYTVITSENNSAISGTFSSINWLGGHTGVVTYTDGAVVLTFQPEIAVSGNDTDIANGDSSPSASDDTDFGTALVAGGTVDHTFTVTNTGTINLTVDNVTTSGTHAADFIVTAQPSTPVEGGAATTFTVQFDPSGVGLREATISFANNDADEDPFTFNIQGYGTAPEIGVSGNDTDISNGDATPSLTDHTDFGEALVAGGTVSRTFTVTNSGAASLTLGNVTTGGIAAADFTITTQPTSPLASSNSTTFVVEFNPSAVGLREATVSFTNNDTDENPFSFSIQGYGTAPEIAVYGNNTLISNGDSTPSTGDHTDFGNMALGGTPIARTFTVTNIGAASLTLGNVTTSGTHAADFTVTTQPTSPLASSNSTTFVVEFDALGSGTRSATISFTNNDDDENPFTFDIQGSAANYPGISQGAGLTQTATVGTDPATQTLTITNIGGGDLSFTITDDQGWLSLSAGSGGPLSSAGTANFTVTYDVSGLSAGTSNATITVTSTGTGLNVASNSPVTIPVQLTLSALPDPVAGTATADGKEMVDLAWTAHGSYSTVMILHKTSAITTDPGQGTAYSAGNTIDGATVIYKGTGSSLEHVVADGTTHYYKFYSVNNDHYSPGISDDVTLDAYGANEIVDQFAYTNTGTLATSGHGNGGSGWTNDWDGTDAAYFNLASGSFADQANYPNSDANKVRINSADIDGVSKQTRRHFTGITTGKVYVGYVMNYAFGGPNKYAGVSFMDGSVEEMFFGEGYNGDQKLAVGGTTSSSNLLAGSGNDYIVIGMYDFDADTGYVASYKIGTDTVPIAEPSTWHATVSDATISRIDGVRLAAGAGAGQGTPGDTYFDEVRVAQSWADLLRIVQTAPGVTNLVVNDGGTVTDEDVATGTMKTVMYIQDSQGVETTNTLTTYFIPNYDILNSTGGTVVADENFSAFGRVDNGQTVIATDTTYAAVSDLSLVTLGVYTSQFSAVNSNGYTTINAATNINGNPLSFTVVDDDTAAPELTTLQSTNSGSFRNLHLSLGSAAISGSGSSTNITYTMTDGQLTTVGGANPLIFWFGARDADSGLARGNTGLETNTALTIGSAVVSNIANYDVTRSSAAGDTGNTRVTNAWSWITAFSAEQIDNLVTNTALGYGTNTVRATVRDADLDRGAVDQLTFESQVGFLVVSDDDIVGPVHSGFTGQGRTLDGATFTNDTELTSGLIITGLVNDADSGVFAGTSNAYILTRNVTQVDSGSLIAGFSDGGNGSLSNTLSSGVISTVGAYTLTVYSVDHDLDRPNDSITTTSVFSFAVVDPPQAPGLVVSPLTLAYTIMLGNNPGVQQTYGVTNSGTGILSYTNQFSYGAGPVSWLLVAPMSNSLGSFASQIHTTEVVGTQFFDAGVYTATNRVNGNQTNAAQELVVTVTVTNIPNPQAVTASADGAELIRLTAQEAAGRTVLVVHSVGADLSVSPTNGATYAVGDALGNGTVAFKFIGSATTTNLEHVVAAGSSHYYRFFAINNSRYSTGITVSATTPSFLAGEIVEPFGYTNAVPLSGRNGAFGWTNAWAVSAPDAPNDVLIDDVNFATFQDVWPSESGNRMLLATDSTDTYEAVRHFDGVTSGQIYVGVLYRRQFSEGSTDGKFSGISFMDGPSEALFIGERGGSGNEDIFGLNGGVAANYGAVNSFPAATDYLIIGKYDFGTDVFEGIYYTSAQAVPSIEPTFFVKVTNSAPTRIDGVRLFAGASSGWNGEVQFDELRISDSWAGLLNLGGVYVTNYIVGNASYEVTDQQVNEGAFAVSLYHYADSGVETVNTVGDFFIPNFDIWNADGTQILTDHVFSAFTYQDNGRVAIGTNDTHVSVDSSDVVLGVYTTRWSAIASNGVATLNSTTLSNGTEMTFTVIDDDTAAPTIMNIRSPESGASRLMHVSYNASAVGANAASADDITYSITDGELASISGGSPLVFYFGAQDSGSGLHRGNTDAAEQSSLTIGSAIVSNVSQWDITRSSTLTNTYDADATNAWSWINPFTPTEIENLITNATSGLAGSNRVTVTFRDRDLDRNDDQSSLVDEPFGWLYVEDDDVDGPELQNFVIEGGNGVGTLTIAELTSGSGWSITGRVRDVDSGINVNGTSTTQPDSSPYYELWDSGGTLRHTAVFDTFAFADGGATTLSSIGDLTPASLASAPTGVWTARVIVADNDEDWGGDRAFTTNEIVFDVIIGASQAGMSLGPSSFNVTSSFGSVAGSANWPWVDVTNNGIGTLTYDATIAYAGGSGWLTVNPDTGVSVASGDYEPTEFAVDASFLNPGTYSATVTFSGNQTNSAQTVTVDLTVQGYYVNEIVDPFTNAVSTGVNDMLGGSGWGNAWTTDPSGAFSVSAGNLSVPNNYPAATGNQICGDATSSELKALRNFATFSTGQVYAAVAVNRALGTSGGFVGLSLMNGINEVAYAGKLFNAEWFGLDVSGNTVQSTFGVYNNTYLMVIKYDFDNDLVEAEIYYAGDTMSLTEPASWRVSYSAAIAQIDGVRLAGKDVGNICFDEIRVARTWETLLNQFTSEPTLHATGLNFRDLDTNSMVVGWSPGNGAARIVVARQGAAPTFTPVDGNNYTANSDFSLATDLGSGSKVVYNGSGTNFTLSGLSAATRYYFEVFEYNGTGGSEDYYTDPTPLAGDRWPLDHAPLNQPTAYPGVADSASQIENTWTASAGSPGASGYLILYQTGGVVSNEPTDGVAYTSGDTIGSATVRLINSGATESVLISGLSACETYDFQIFAFGYDGSNDETYNYLTASAPTTTAETECVAPTLQSSNIVFSVIGTDTITATWDPGDGDGRVVVVRGTNTVNQNPVDGTTYTASTTFGSGSDLGDGNYVVYIGSTNQVTVTGLEPGVNYSFQVFEYNGSGSGIDYNITTATLNPRSSETSPFELVYEYFDYDKFNYGNLNGASVSGSGWTNAWSTGSGLVEHSPNDMADFGAYPADSGLQGDGTTGSGFMDMSNSALGTRTAQRNFDGATAGKLYISVKVFNGHYMGASDFVGIDILNGNVTTAFFGKASGVADRKLSIDYNSNVSTNRLDGTNPSGYEIGNTAGYLLVAEYDFDAQTLKVKSYVENQIAHANPDLEGAWDVEMENVVIDRIDGIKFVASDNDQIVNFDSIRIGPSWERVVWNLPDNHHEDYGPVATLVYIGTNYNPSFYGMVITNLSDAELRSGVDVDFAVRWEHVDGIFITNNNPSLAITNIGSPNGRVNPNWDPLAVGAATNRFNLDKFFTNFFGYNGATVITTYQLNAFSITNINFENQYFVTVSAEDEPGGDTVTAPNGADDIPVERAIRINDPLRFYIYDDDTNPPVRGATSPLMVMTSTVAASSQSATPDLDRWFVTDGALASVGMRISLNAYDTYSGLQRASAGDVSTNLSLTIGNLTTNNIADYVASESSATSTGVGTTNLWHFPNTVFDSSRISSMWGGDGSSPQGIDSYVTVTMPDADEDRVEDQAFTSNEWVGILRVLDDDTAPPYVTNIAGFGNGSANQYFYVITNGIRLDGTIRSQDRRDNTLSNVVWTITDGEALNMGDNDVGFVFGAADRSAGLQRGITGDTNTVMSFSIGDVKSGIFNRFDAGSSSPATGDRTTNVFLMANSDFDETDVETLLGIETPVYVTIPDADNDRQKDQATLYDEHVGYFRVIDDDLEPPVMSNLNISVSSVHTLINMGFDLVHGWTNGGVASLYGDYANTVGTNEWYGTNILVTSSPYPPTDTVGRRVSGTRVMAFQDTTSVLQMPERTTLGTLFVWARLSSGTGPRELTLEGSTNGVDWTNFGAEEITSSEEYQQLRWTIEEEDNPMVLRLRRTGSTLQTIYIDDIMLTKMVHWTNAATVTMSWDNAWDEQSGVYQYRLLTNDTPTLLKSTNISEGIVLATNSLSIEFADGINTGFVFSVDSDNDRSNDRVRGGGVPFVLKSDRVLPLAVTGARASDAAAQNLFGDIDESSEIKVEWAPASADEAEAAGWRASDNEPLSPWDSYQITYYEVTDAGIPLGNNITSVLDRTVSAWSNVLNTHTFTNLVLSNLVFDSYYKIEIQGRDRAGNIGPIVVVTGNTDRFVVTQGLNRVGLDLEVRWKGVVGRDYDVLRVDSSSGFRDALSNQWAFMLYTNEPTMFDTGSVSRVRPGELTNHTYRFYRVAKKDRWIATNNVRLASEEIYVTK
ncbi:MAG: choice-of-anchor D domain-containing protein, partial [Kiritimatiellae bacterium]|nr:choice-of-anchor D domain-containing protein [Kiritimatiellia bacterium]